VTASGAAKDEVLARVRQALAGAAGPAPAVRDYRQGTDEPAGEEDQRRLVELLTDRLQDYRATVHQVAAGQAAATAVASRVARIAADLSEHTGEAARLVVAPDFPLKWRAGWQAVEDDGFTAAELDAIDGAVTTCRVAIAETGTLVLDAGPGQGRRAITLVPDLHVCVVMADQVVESVPAALRRLDPARPLTFVRGPSATSDIELQRVEGVHGPRTLHVLLVSSDPSR
jgi:L-lactate dehydrogenase complex protein LldG